MKLKAINNTNNSKLFDEIISSGLDKDEFLVKDFDDPSNYFLYFDYSGEIKTFLFLARELAKDNNIFFEFWGNELIVKSKEIIKPKRIIGRKLVQ